MISLTLPQLFIFFCSIHFNTIKCTESEKYEERRKNNAVGGPLAYRLFLSYSVITIEFIDMLTAAAYTMLRRVNRSLSER
jgi:hypothetical protein